MRTMSVHQTLKHINNPLCLYCGRKLQNRGALVSHIASCKVYETWRMDLQKIKSERDDESRRADRTALTLSNHLQTISHLQEQLEAARSELLALKAKHGTSDNSD